MAKSFSDIKGGDIEGQIKLNRGEKPEPPKEPEPPFELQTMESEGINCLFLTIAFLARDKNEEPEKIADYFGRAIQNFLQDSINRNYISKRYWLEGLCTWRISSDRGDLKAQEAECELELLLQQEKEA